MPPGSPTPTASHPAMVGIVGGTGWHGRALAWRLARAGHYVTIGSRIAARARSTAAILATLPGANAGTLAGADNATAALASIVIVTVPYTAHGRTLNALREHLTGRIVIDCVNPLAGHATGLRLLPVLEGSAAQQAAALLPKTHVVAALNLSAQLLADTTLNVLRTDVFVLGDDPGAVSTVSALVRSIPGLRPIVAGGLRNARHVEAITAHLIALDQLHQRQPRATTPVSAAMAVGAGMRLR